MLNLISMVIGAVVGYLPHLIFGDSMLFFTDFLVSTVVGGAAYIFAFYKLKKIRGDF